MTTANLSVGIKTEQARQDLLNLKDFMRSQLSSMALSINAVSLEASIKKAMLGPSGNGYTLKINASQLKTDLSTAMNDAMAGVSLGGISSADMTKMKSDLGLVKQHIITAANEANFGEKMAKDLEKNAPRFREAGKKAGKASAEGFNEEQIKYANLSHRAKLGAGTLSVSEKSEYTAAEVKAMAEAVEQEREQLRLQRQQNQERREAVRLQKELVAENRRTAARLFAEGKNLAPDNLTAKGRAQFGAQYAVGKGVAEDMLPNGAAGLLQSTTGLEKATKQLGNAHKDATIHTKTHAEAMRDAHSAARGLASGFGAMWLTWGNLAPLLAGAALSHGFIQAMKAGTEFAYQLTFVKALGGETSESISGIGKAALEMSKGGLYGPVELANGLRVLNQAGISTKESMMALPQVFNLATVGEMSMSEAAITLAGVMTAFNLQVKDMSHIGDVFAKAAAMSQTSVEQMTQAMKTASVVGDQYGASMEDTATALTLLAKVNITGTAAGTSLRNMLKELYSPTEKAKEVMKTLGVEAETANGKLRSFPDIIYSMKASLEKYTQGSQIKLLQAMFGERGAKEAIAMLSQTREEWDKLNKTISESEGFMAQASAALEETTKGSFKQAVNTLQSTLIGAFENSEGAAKQLAVQLKNTFNSEEFKASINGIVTGVLTVTNLLVEHAKVLAGVGAAWVAFQLTIAARAGWGLLATAITDVTMTLKAFTLVATGAATVTGGATGLAAALRMVVNPVTAVIAVVASLTAGLGYLWSRMSENAAATALAERTNNLANVMVNLRNKIADANRELLRQEAIKKGGTSESSAYDKEVSESQTELNRLKKEKAEVYSRVAAGDMNLKDFAQLSTLQKKVEESESRLAKASKERAGAQAEEAAYNANRLRIALSETRDSIRGIDERKATPEQLKTIKALKERLEGIDRASVDILGAGLNSYGITKLEEDLRDEAQKAKMAAGKEVWSGGGGGRASREAGKLENAEIKNVLKDQAAIEKLYDTHYKRLIDLENASAQAGLITREQAEDKVTKLTEEQLNARMEINKNYHSALQEMLKTAKDLTPAQREQLTGEIERRGILLLELREELDYKKQIAEINRLGAEKRFNDNINKNNVELTKELEIAKAAVYGKITNPVDRARDNGETLVSNRYAQMIQEAVDARIRAEEMGDEASIKATAERLERLNQEVQTAKKYYGDQYAALAEYQQTGMYGWERFWEKYQEEAITAAKVVEGTLNSVTKNIEDAFSEMFTTGTLDFKKMTKAILADMGKLVAKMAVADIGNIITGKGKTSGTILGEIFGGKSAEGGEQSGLSGMLTKAADGLKGFWNSLTGATTATQDSTAKTVESVLTEGTKKVADTSATAAMTELAAAAQMAAAQLSTIGATGGGSGGGLLGAIGGLAGGSEAASAAADFIPYTWAKGGAFNAGVKAFAKGGTFTNRIVSQPTLFRFADGVGMMGEAGAEAIMPLGRDSQGRLGVRYEGREPPNRKVENKVTNNNVSVSINAPGGDPAKVRRSGAAVAREVVGAITLSGRYR